MRVSRGGQRGRPKAKREGVDLGTPQARKHRAALAGGGEARLAEYPLGIMLARGLIDAVQHEAGCYYAYLYRRVMGRTHVNCARAYRERVDASGLTLEPPPNESLERLEALFRVGKNRLLAAGRRVCDATENLVVFARLPRFLDLDGRRGPAARGADAMELGAVIDGLDTLIAAYGRVGARWDGERGQTMPGIMHADRQAAE